MLQDALDADPTSGLLGIAHTRWATHGVPSERNAHPHISRDGIALVHNGIIENHEELRAELQAAGYEFTSETDTEVIAHRVHYHLQKTGDLFKAVRATVAELEGAYALAVISQKDPERLVLARQGCPVVIGLGDGENFVASDVAALLPVTRKFVFLEEGDVCEIRRDSYRILDKDGNTIQRKVHESELSADAAEKGDFPHYMLKEIHEQPRAVAQTLEERVAGGKLLEAAFGPAAQAVFARTEAVRIVACGTSFHAAVVAKYFIEQICRLPCWVEIASEYRYRNPVVPKNTLFVSVSQSGETADTLAALRMAKQAGYLSQLAICNVPESSLVRESELVMLTRAGPEIGVASTKAFTTQLTALGMLVVALAKFHSADAERERGLVQRLLGIPSLIEATLKLDPVIKDMAKRFVDKHHALFLGRGPMYPIAMEGALKLKEISYIHAEAYPAGELEARSARTRRRRHADRHGRAEQRPAREAEVEPDGSARARRRAVRVRRSGVRYGVVGRRARDRDAAARELLPGAGGVHDSAAAAGVSLRDPQRHGRRSAAEPREVGHGGVVSRVRAAIDRGE